jgi:hypothetical protein
LCFSNWGKKKKKKCSGGSKKEIKIKRIVQKKKK